MLSMFIIWEECYQVNELSQTKYCKGIVLGDSKWLWIVKVELTFVWHFIGVHLICSICTWYIDLSIFKIARPWTVINSLLSKKCELYPTYRVAMNTYPQSFWTTQYFTLMIKIQIYKMSLKERTVRSFISFEICKVHSKIEKPPTSHFPR
jgi:hypothetical protein